jgi:probable F420-dependent oxidoreductase
MKLGIWLPLVLKTPPHVTEPWEMERDVDDIATFASIADEAGYDYLFAADHVALPVELEATRGNAYWDPFSTLGFVAAHTQRAQLIPLVLVAAYHHPLAVAKRMATIDMLSKGRAAIGIGVGSLVQEFAMLGLNMKERGRRADDMLRALIASRGERVPTYDGEFWSFRDMIVDPWLRKDMPLWVGGLAPKSVKRAAVMGDVWSPTRLPIEDIGAALRDPEVLDLLAAREKPLEVVYIMSGPAPFDALGRPQEIRDMLKRLQDNGMTGYAPELEHQTREIYADQLRAMAEIAKEF